jgi:formate hydrogenlyase subunit 4
MSSWGDVGVSRETFLGLSITLIILTAVFVAIRLAASVKTVGRFTVDDCAQNCQLGPLGKLAIS